MDEELTLVAAEAFGPTIQGEGSSAGQRAGFIRLGGCNLHCSWCDTPYTWDARRYDLREELKRVLVSDLVSTALHGHPGIVVITGGEPLLHQKQLGWDLLLDMLMKEEVRIEVETNGTVHPENVTVSSVSQFNVSPKLSHSGDPEDLRIDYHVLRSFLASGKAIFKFVCCTVDDLLEVSDISLHAGIPSHLIWIMPEGTSAVVVDNRLHELADTAINCFGYNVTSRMHVMLWGDKRGR